MKQSWLNELKVNPVIPLYKKGHLAIRYWVDKDLLNRSVNKLRDDLNGYKPLASLLKKQNKNGSWDYPGKKAVRSKSSYDLYQTTKILNILVFKYDINKKHPAIKSAAAYLLGSQSKEGDFRGIYAAQYSPNYTAYIMEPLIYAGYEKDRRIGKAFKWLLSIRQHDGGWAIPFRTNSAMNNLLSKALSSKITIRPDKNKPFSHCITGVVLRAFAAHPQWKNSKAARRAGRLLAARFFQADKYPDRKAATFWKNLVFPYQYTDILSSLDALSLLGFDKNYPEIKRALGWLVKNQRQNGLWQSGYGRGKEKEMDLWVTLAAARVVKRFYH